MPTHNDEPCLIDQLLLNSLSKEIAEKLADCAPPHVFGLHGDWGSGKTSLLHQIHHRLSGSCPLQNVDKLIEDNEEHFKDIEQVNNHNKIRVVWFEAWRYQNEPAPIVALLHEIREQLGWEQRIKGKASKLTAVAIRGALLSMEDLTKKIGFQASKVEKAGIEWEKEHLAMKLPSNTIREQLEQAINGLVGNSRKRQEREQTRVVVLIDDIDRCEPEAAYRLLEGLKIYLTLSNCVVLLGMNQSIVEDAIGKHIPAANENKSLRKERAAAYLEKMCQNIWRVPFVKAPKDYLLCLLEDRIQRDWIDRALGDRVCLPPNPRRLKGLANLLERWIPRLSKNTGILDDQKMIREAKHMLVVAQFHQFHHDIYRRWAHDPGFWDKICGWAINSITSSLSITANAYRASTEKLFQTLEPVLNTSVDERSATPQEVEESSAFPDPAESNVCWAQPLIVDLYNQDQQLPAEGFIPFLRPYH